MVGIKNKTWNNEFLKHSGPVGELKCHQRKRYSSWWRFL